MNVRRSLLAATVLAVAFVPLLLAQPGSGRPTTSWLIRAHVYLGDKGLQKELQLTDEQARKATELANTARTRSFSYSRADDKEREQIDTECKKELDAFLKPDQMTRLREVILQNMANARLGATPLLGDAEVVKRLKFTEEQTQKIRDRAKLEDVLNEEQKKEWVKLTGKPYTERLRPQIGGERPAPRPILPVALQYLAAKSISDELKLTEKQQEQVKALAAKYEKALGNTDNTKKADNVRAAGDKEARGILEAAQAKRLAQIEFKLETRGQVREDALLKDKRVVAALKLSDELLKKIDATREKRQKEMLPLFARDEDAKKIIENVQAFTKETMTQLVAVLDQKQQAAFKDLVGEPFSGERPEIRRPDTDGGGDFPTPLYVHGTGAAYLGSPDLHKELKVDAATAEKLTTLAERERRAGFGGGGGALSTREQAEANRKEVATLLDARQIKRFEEVYLAFLANNRPAKGGGFPRATSIASHVEVQEALNLTDEQKRKLNDGEPMDKVLDEAQVKKWKEMRGEPFTGTLVSAGPSGIPTRQYLYDAAATYAGSSDLHKELKVNDETAKKLTAFAERAYQGRISSFFQKAAPKTTFKPSKERAQANKKELATLLDTRQMKRFEEVFLGVAAEGFPIPFGKGKDSAKGPPTAHRHIEVQEALKLTDEQMAKLTAREPMDKVLDEAQAKKWKEMRGEPFTGTLVLQGGFGVGPTATLHVYGTGAAYVGSPDLHKELKVSAETARKLRAFATKSSGVTFAKGGPELGQATKERAEANKKELAKLLDARQMKRFEEVYLAFVANNRPAKGGGFPFATPISRYVEVQEALKLTAEQRTKLNRGDAMDTVLDETQAKAWKQLTGEKFEGSLVSIGSFGMTGFNPSQPLILSALETPAVVTELKISNDQQKQLDSAEQTFWEKDVKLYLDRNRKQDPRSKGTSKQSQGLRGELEQAIKKTLDDKQNTRLQQILLQDSQKRGGLQTLLSRAAVAKALKLDDEQQKKLTAINTDTNRLEMLLFAEYGRTTRALEAHQKTVDAINKNADKRREATLTAKQKDDLKALLGEPFKGEIQRPARMRGFSGFDG